MTNLDSILKSRDITLLTKVHLAKVMVLPIVMYGCESGTVKGACLALPGMKGPAGAGGAGLAHSTEPLMTNRHACTHTMAQVRCLRWLQRGVKWPVGTEPALLPQDTAVPLLQDWPTPTQPFMGVKVPGSSQWSTRYLVGWHH